MSPGRSDKPPICAFTLEDLIDNPKSNLVHKVKMGSNGRPVQTPTKSKLDAKKTPASLLNEICQSGGAILTYLEIPRPNDRWPFKILARVQPAEGTPYEGIGEAQTKKEAKHKASRNVLLKLSPESESLLLPSQDESLTELIYEDVHSALELSQRGEEYEDAGDFGELKEDFEETQDNQSDRPKEVEVEVSEIDGYTEVKVRVPNTQPAAKSSVPVKVTLDQKMEIVKQWKGPIVEKLKTFSFERISAIKEPLKVFEKLAKEQNLRVTVAWYGIDQETGKDKNYICEVEATTAAPDSDDGESHPSLNLNEKAIGSAPQECLKQVMIQMLMRVRAYMTTYMTTGLTTTLEHIMETIRTST